MRALASRPRYVVCLLWLAAALCTTVGGQAETASVDERWYSVELAGGRAGWMVERRFQDERGLVTETETEMRLDRGGTEIRLGFASRFVETAQGKPVSMWSRQALGQIPIETEYLFAEDHLLERSRQGDTTQERKRPLPEGRWLTPAATQREIRRHVREGSTRFTLRTLDPTAGPTPVEVTSEKLDDAGALPGRRWEQSSSLMPGVTTIVEFDAEGYPEVTTSQMLGLEMVFRRSSKTAALEQKGPAPELLVRSFVKPDRSLESPRTLARARYRLKAPAEADLTPPQAASQRVEASGGEWFTIAVDVERPVAQELSAEERIAYLEASAYLNFRDERVAALAATVELSELAPAARAEALRALVGRALDEKNLETGFGTASEAAAARSGDCTEHAVLLTALLRSTGIPARVVSGLLYVESFVGEQEIFGYHMWSQAWLDGAWVDLDAMGARPFDAAHIALATSPLNDYEDVVSTSGSIAALMGAIEIRVLESAAPP